MKELRIHRNYKDKFTVTLAMPNFSAFPYDGIFCDDYQYYRVDTEEELINELNKEDTLLDESIETIYFNGKEVTEKYLRFVQGTGYKLLARWKA